MSCGGWQLDEDELDARYLAILARWPSGDTPEWALSWAADMPSDEKDLGESDCRIFHELEASATALEQGLLRLREEKARSEVEPVPGPDVTPGRHGPVN